MSILRPITFIPGWGFQASIAKNIFFPCKRLINLPSLETSPTTIDTLCDAIEKEMQPSETILIGWSLGGLISINLYARHPERYKSLILITSTPCFWAQSNWLGISKEHQTIFTNALNQEYPIFLAYYLTLLSKPFRFSKFNPYLQSHMIPKEAFNGCKSYKDILFKADLRLAYSKIQIPTLVIQGEKDAIIPSGLNQYLVKLNPSPEYHTIHNAGHLPFMTHQKETNKIVTDFLKKIS
ncbi:MAG: alpha/beta fold hydrolase [Proteobacteria bacterium]|nr:alpha/beta fold hydrolase [Pseudomonadota bacterium]